MPQLRQLLQLKISPVMGAEARVWVPALVFLITLSAFESVVFGHGVGPLVKKLVTGSDMFGALAGIAYALAALYISFLFTIGAIASRWRYKPFYIVLLSLALFIEYGYSRAIGRFTNFYDIVSAWSAAPQQAYDSVFAYADPTALLPSAVLCGLCIFITPRPNTAFGIGKLFFILTATLLFYVHFFYVNQLMFDRGFVSHSFGSFWQTNVDYFMIDPFRSVRDRARQPVDSPIDVAMRPANNIVFIFDESIRGDHLSLNGYHRQTTPYLESLAMSGAMTNWGIASSASTISHPSYDAMITGSTPQMLESLNMTEINSLPTLFQYAKAMNYQTHLIDGQMKNYWGGNPEDINYIDNFVSMKDIGGEDRIEDWERGSKITGDDIKNDELKQWDIDEVVAGIVNQIMTTSSGNFVFVYKRGSHFPYEKNYPEKAALWKPIYTFTDLYEIPPADQINAVVNSYDNALRFNLDNFFRKLAPNYSDLPNNTVIIYTSDHGESFYANGKAGHGGITREEATVPLFVLGRLPKPADTRFRASHANVFSGLLDLMSYPAEMRRFPYAPSLLEGSSTTLTKRFYNPPPGRAYPFDLD